MKTALVIGCILLMQQSAFARRPDRSWESKESSEEYHQYIVAKQTDAFGAFQVADGPTPAGEILVSPRAVDLAPRDHHEIWPSQPETTSKCGTCTDPSKPVCAMNYRLIVLFDNQCWLDVAKCRNPDIVWQTLPLEICGVVKRPHGNPAEGVLGIAEVDDDDTNERDSHESHSRESWEA